MANAEPRGSLLENLEEPDPIGLGRPPFELTGYRVEENGLSGANTRATIDGAGQYNSCGSNRMQRRVAHQVSH